MHATSPGLLHPLHVLLDEVLLLGSVLIQGERSFVRTPEGPPPSYEHILAEVLAAPPSVGWPDARPGRAFRAPVDIPTVGERTKLDFLPGRAKERDTLLVWHHGIGEPLPSLLPTVMQRLALLGRRVDVVALHAVHHESTRAMTDRFLASRNGLLRNVAASAGMAVKVLEHLGPRYAHRVLGGVSLGGMVTLSEAIYVGGFDLYVPVLAGPALSDVLLYSTFSRMVEGRFLKREARSEWVERLDLTGPLRRSAGAPIRPLLARSDTLFRLGPQLAAYAGAPRVQVSLCEGGHLTGSVALPTVARHLRRALRETRWEPKQEAVAA